MFYWQKGQSKEVWFLWLPSGCTAEKASSNWILLFLKQLFWVHSLSEPEFVVGTLLNLLEKCSSDIVKIDIFFIFLVLSSLKMNLLQIFSRSCWMPSIMWRPVFSKLWFHWRFLRLIGLMLFWNWKMFFQIEFLCSKIVLHGFGSKDDFSKVVSLLQLKLDNTLKISTISKDFNRIALSVEFVQNAFICSKLCSD